MNPGYRVLRSGRRSLLWCHCTRGKPSEPAEGSAKLSSADRITAHTGEAAIEDPEGNEIDITAVEVGDRVVIFFDGTIDNHIDSFPVRRYILSKEDDGVCYIRQSYLLDD